MIQQNQQNQQTPEWNSCSNLTESPEFAEAKEIYRDLLNNGMDPFKHMLDMQFVLQADLTSKLPDANPHPDNLKTVGEKFDWLQNSKIAFDDEFREIIDALPGMNLPSKDRSAVWKTWKSKHAEIRNRTFEDLTEDELKELKFELTDSFHFFLKMFFALDMTAEEMFVYYYTKNAENLRRVEGGY